MKVSDLTDQSFREKLAGTGLKLQIGQFTYHISSPIESVAEGIGTLYSSYSVISDLDFCDFHVAVRPPSSSIRQWVKPQAIFSVDSRMPFESFPLEHSLPLLEWGMNWCVSTYVNYYLKIHAAVIEKDGGAIIMPASPGSGKSTLCAGLVINGWRLFSDELALIDFLGDKVYSYPRPIGLKNESIEVIRGYGGDGITIGPVANDTHKGKVAHMKAPDAAIAQAGKPASPKRIVFPKYKKGSRAILTQLTKAEGFERVAINAFNYSLLGEKGFLALVNMIRLCDCYEFTYSDLDDAAKIFDDF
jgi:HprK-related kinase A